MGRRRQGKACARWRLAHERQRFDVISRAVVTCEKGAGRRGGSIAAGIEDSRRLAASWIRPVMGDLGKMPKPREICAAILMRAVRARSKNCDICPLAARPGHGQLGAEEIRVQATGRRNAGNCRSSPCPRAPLRATGPGAQGRDFKRVKGSARRSARRDGCSTRRPGPVPGLTRSPAAHARTPLVDRSHPVLSGSNWRLSTIPSLYKLTK